MAEVEKSGDTQIGGWLAFAGVVLFLFYFCAKSSGGSSAYVPSQDSVDRAQFMTAVSPFLKDSESARWGAVWRTPGGDLCGMVNAKNSFGAFAGEEMFMIAAGQTFNVSSLSTLPANKRKGLEILAAACGPRR